MQNKGFLVFFQLASIFSHPILLFVPSLQSTGDPEALNVRLRPLLEMVLFLTAEGLGLVWLSSVCVKEHEREYAYVVCAQWT